MKLATTVLIAALGGAVACSHHQPPRTAQATPATTPKQTALVVPPEPAKPPIVPGAASIPQAPATLPYAPTSKPPAETPLTKSSSFASPPASLPSPAVDPVRDQSETSNDAESVHEIRALLAADKSLSATARQVTIVARKGRVRLSGQVNTAEERAAVERYARQAANVIDVTNQLVILE